MSPPASRFAPRRLSKATGNSSCYLTACQGFVGKRSRTDGSITTDNGLRSQRTKYHHGAETFSPFHSYGNVWKRRSAEIALKELALLFRLAQRAQLL